MTTKRIKDRIPKLFGITHIFILLAIASIGIAIGFSLKFFMGIDNQKQPEITQIIPIQKKYPTSLDSEKGLSYENVPQSEKKLQKLPKPKENLSNIVIKAKNKEEVTIPKKPVKQGEKTNIEKKSPPNKEKETKKTLLNPKPSAFAGKTLKTDKIKTNKKRLIAIVVDDMGINESFSRKIVKQKKPLTLAYLPYGAHIKRQTAEAIRYGHELIMHLPMEPINQKVNPGPNALLSGIEKVEFLATLEWNLNQFDGFIGVNNHMGSNFTTDLELMSVLLQELKSRDLFFLDSLTNQNSIGEMVARRIKLPFLKRDIFIDHIDDISAIKKQLRKLEKMSIKRGTAIGICHPRAKTFKVLTPWLNSLEERGFQLVSLSTIISK